ncbi:MAG: DUF1587 domain-containing protein [Deltaproteobacteria bacterium]|nr:DUF1587 domain-containing protein [Deltaproteobacteria bacterium]
MRRLSRADYLNSVRDLVGDFAVEARELPFDQLGYLFPNIGGTQSLERFDLERYLAVAEEVVARAWSRRAETPAVVPVVETGAAPSPATGFAGNGALGVDDATELALHVPAPQPGDVALHLRAHLPTAPAGAGARRGAARGAARGLRRRHVALPRRGRRDADAQPPVALDRGDRRGPAGHPPHRGRHRGGAAAARDRPRWRARAGRRAAHRRMQSGVDGRRRMPPTDCGALRTARVAAPAGRQRHRRVGGARA